MKVSIIGAAGTLGTCTAFTLAVEKIAEEIVMIDINRNYLMGHALDMGLATVGRDVEITPGEYRDMSNSDVVIMVASAPGKPGVSPDEVIKDNIPIINEAAKNIVRFCPDAVVITASNPADSLNYAMYLRTDLDRKKVLGYTMNDTLRFRMAVARALSVKSSDVEALAIGEHARLLAYLFSRVSVKGLPVTFNEDLKQRIRLEIPGMLRTFVAFQTGRTMGWTSAVGLADMVRVIRADTEKAVPCSIALEGEYGYEGFSLGVPVVLGHGGVQQILEWELAPDEKEELNRAAVSLKKSAKLVN
jgi:malate dehydrogenase